MGLPKTSSDATVVPVTFAVAIALLLVGLIVDPLVIAPIGGVIAIAAAVLWVRRGEQPEAAAVAPRPVAEASDERYSRSQALERVTLALGGLVGMGVALPAVGFAILPSFLTARHRHVDLGPISAFPENEFVVATFLADPRAGEVSRRAAYVRNNGFVDNVPSFTILSSRCTHVGCPTQPNGPVFARQRKAEHTSGGEVGLVPTLAAGFGCPCHGSQFDTEGNRTAGPAPRALDRYAFSIRNGRLTLGRLYSVSRVDGTGARARIHGFPLTGAGVPVTGTESLLYPLSPPS